MTFEKIMEFYPEGNQSAFDGLVEAMGKDIKPVPFVGAGLSAAFGYPGWESILRELAKLVPAAKQDKVFRQIKSKQLLEAAQTIADTISESRMLRAVKKKLPDAGKQVGGDRLLNSAAFLLPRLFPDSPVMTTNFDRVLEHIYHKADKPLTPVYCDQVSLLGETRQQSRRHLVKLHGTIDETGLQSPVFTLEQYKKAYTGDVLAELKQWFQNRVLLFLGCSLDIDETMKTLRQVVEQCPSIEHYAIVSCKQEELEQRIKEVGELGIEAIFYPDGKYDSVRVILEKLLEAVDNEAYQALPRPEIPKSPSAKFLYDAGFIPFFGREEELKKLEAFCACPGPIRWWAITGPGGTGKSRLAYEFTNRKREEGWNIQWINSRQKMTGLAVSYKKTILVVDDAQLFLSTLGQWLGENHDHVRSEPLRILLLERDGKDLGNASWGDVMLSRDLENYVQEMCHDREFLEVKKLNDKHLRSILTSCFKAQTGRELEDARASSALEKLAQLDPGLSRPLYAMAIADALASGEDPVRWDPDTLLDRVAGKELQFYRHRLLGLLGGENRKRKAEQELTELMVTACIKGFILLDEITPERYPNLSKAARKMDMELAELLEQTGLVGTVHMKNIETEEEREFRAVSLNCPDPVKEYLVLKETVLARRLDALFPEGWDGQPGYLSFNIRLILKYPEHLKNSQSFWERFFTGAPKDSLNKWLYGETLCLIPHDYPAQARQAVERLESMMEDEDRAQPIALQYARALVNLTIKADQAECRDVAERLKKLWDTDAFREDQEITRQYAVALFNLTVNADQAECRDAAERLKELWDTDAFREDQKIALAYARALHNLTAEADLAECRDVAERLKKLWDTDAFREDQKITLAYARALHNLTVEADQAECREVVKRLKELWDTDAFREDQEITLQYAKALVNLTVEADLVECMEVVKRLKELWNTDAFREDQKITLQYAGALHNLTVEADQAECREVVKRLKELWDTDAFREDQEITLQYANALVSLAFKLEDPEEIRKVLAQSESLLSRHREAPEFQLLYAQTWFNLTLRLEGEELAGEAAGLRRWLAQRSEADRQFQEKLDLYLKNHPEHTDRYRSLRP